SRRQTQPLRIAWHCPNSTSARIHPTFHSHGRRSSAAVATSREGHRSRRNQRPDQLSALAHFADSSRTSHEVREVPIPLWINRSKEASLFDHLVGSQQDRCRERNS